MNKLFRRADVWVLLAVLCLSALLYLPFYPKSKGSVASVRYRGEVIDTVPLLAADGEERTYTLPEGEIRIRFFKDGAEILSSPCKGQNCIHTGKVTKSGESVVCLPLGFSVILSGESTLDGVTG